MFLAFLIELCYLPSFYFSMKKKISVSRRTNKSFYNNKNRTIEPLLFIIVFDRVFSSLFQWSANKNHEKEKKSRGEKKEKKKYVTKSKRIIKVRSMAVESVWGVQRCAEVHFGNHWHEGTQTWPCPAEWSITPSLRWQRVILYNTYVCIACAKDKETKNIGKEEWEEKLIKIKFANHYC